MSVQKSILEHIDSTSSIIIMLIDTRISHNLQVSHFPLALAHIYLPQAHASPGLDRCGRSILMSIMTVYWEHNN